MSKPTTILALALLVLACSGLPEQSSGADQPEPLPDETESTLDSLIEQNMDAGGIVGLGAAVIVNKQLAWMNSYGFADRDKAAPFTPNTIMNVGSISKTFTGVALMRAVQEKVLSLDDDINNYLPFRVTHAFFPNEPITLRQLATHTSGISDRPSIYEAAYHYGGDSPEPLGTFVRDYFASDGKYYSKDNFLDVRPGRHREYSNIAAALAGYIIEVAVGEPLNVYTKQHIFAPLGMDDTGWFLSEIDLAKHSKLYDRQGRSTTPVQLYGLTTYPDGGVRTSVADLAKFFIALLNEGEYEGARILETQTVKEMLRFQFTESSKPDNISLNEKNSGIFWSTKYDVTRIGHGGSDPGIQAAMLSDLSKEIGVILLMNTSLDDPAERHYVEIFANLWSYAGTLKDREVASH